MARVVAYGGEEGRVEASQVREGGGGHPPLKRGIGRVLLLFFVVGDIVGAGIYALVGEVGAVTGGAIWTAFLSAFVLAAFTAASYVELVTKYPRAGGSATYAHNAFRTPFVSFIVAFAVAASSITSASVLTLAFSGDYLSQFINVPTLVAAVVFLLVVSFINFYGISESVRINVVLTCIELFGLFLIILIGVLALGGGTGDVGRAFEFREGSAAIPAVLAGTVLAFYALIGFDDSVNVAEEVQGPSRAYPFAIFGGLALAGIIYLLVTITASMVVPTDALAESSGPLLEVVDRGTLPISTTFFAAIALLAVSNGALINLIMASRVVYGMGDQDVLPRIFSTVHPSRRTPWISILFVGLITLILILTVGRNEDALSTLSSTTVVLLLSAFVVVNVSVLVLRRDPVDHEHFRTPTALPILGIAVSGSLLIYTAVTNLPVFGLAALLIGVGVILYVINVFVKRGLDRESPR
jgi:basic amino acid/polyamine antiporter, APA family